MQTATTSRCGLGRNGNDARGTSPHPERDNHDRDADHGGLPCTTWPPPDSADTASPSSPGRCASLASSVIIDGPGDQQATAILPVGDHRALLSLTNTEVTSVFGETWAISDGLRESSVVEVGLDAGVPGLQTWSGTNRNTLIGVPVGDEGGRLMVGTLIGALSYRVGEETRTLELDAYSDVVAVRTAAGGQVQWARALGLGVGATLSALHDLGDGSVLLAVEREAADLSLPSNIREVGQVARLSAEGQLEWVTSVVAAHDVTVTDVSHSSESGEIYVGGSLRPDEVGDPTLLGDPLHDVGDEANLDHTGWLAGLSADGRGQWFTTVPATYSSQVEQVAALSAGGVLAAGRHRGDALFSAAHEPPVRLPGLAQTDAWLARWDGTGRAQRAVHPPWVSKDGSSVSEALVVGEDELVWVGQRWSPPPVESLGSEMLFTRLSPDLRDHLCTEVLTRRTEVPQKPYTFQTVRGAAWLDPGVLTLAGFATDRLVVMPDSKTPLAHPFESIGAFVFHVRLE